VTRTPRGVGGSDPWQMAVRPVPLPRPSRARPKLAQLGGSDLMPWAPLRRCLEPGCTARQHGARCAQHDRVSPRNHRGAPPSARGYDAGYRRRRAALLGAPCAMRLRGCTGTATTAQHTDAGDLVPACAHCNFADGARRAHAARAAGAGP